MLFTVYQQKKGKWTSLGPSLFPFVFVHFFTTTVICSQHGMPTIAVYPGAERTLARDRAISGKHYDNIGNSKAEKEE